MRSNEVAREQKMGKRWNCVQTVEVLFQLTHIARSMISLFLFLLLSHLPCCVPMFAPQQAGEPTVVSDKSVAPLQCLVDVI